MKLLSYINTKLCGVSLSIHTENFGENFAIYLCITEIISAALNDKLFLLVRICRRILLPIRQSPLLIYRDFGAFGHDFLKNLQFVHGSSPYRIISTPENYLLWRWACMTLNEVLRSADGLSDTLRRSFPHKNNCTLQGAAGSHIIGITYRISHSDLVITENDSISGRIFLKIFVQNGGFSVDRWGRFSCHQHKMAICKHSVNFLENPSHFSIFPGR